MRPEPLYRFEWDFRAEAVCMAEGCPYRRNTDQHRGDLSCHRYRALRQHVNRHVRATGHAVRVRVDHAIDVSPPEPRP